MSAWELRLSRDPPKTIGKCRRISVFSDPMQDRAGRPTFSFVPTNVSQHESAPMTNKRPTKKQTLESWWHIEMQVKATAYICASSQEEAEKIALTLEWEWTGPDGAYADAGPDEVVPISGLPLNHPDLPGVFLSPEMSIHSIWPGATMQKVAL
jgi:hypothetical protein